MRGPGRGPGAKSGEGVLAPAGRHVRAAEWWWLRLVRVAGREGVRVGSRDGGAIAVEFALLATLVAGLSFGVAVVIGASVEHPLQLLGTVLNGLTGSAGAGDPGGLPGSGG